MSDFYLYIDGGLAALSTSMTIVHITKEIVDYYSHTKNKSLDEIEEYLDYLEEQGYILYDHEFIEVGEINVRGREETLRSKLEILIPKFMIQSHIQPDCIYRNKSCPPSYYNRTVVQRCSENVGLSIARYIGILKRKWFIDKHWHKCYPEYEWDINLGAPSYNQSLVCLTEGISYEYHYWDYLKTIPLIWLDRLKRFDVDYLFTIDYIKHPPIWWTNVFGKDCDFLSFMNDEQYKRTMSLARGIYIDTNFKETFLEVYPSIQNPKYIRAHEWDWLLP